MRFTGIWKSFPPYGSVWQELSTVKRRHVFVREGIQYVCEARPIEAERDLPSGRHIWYVRVAAREEPFGPAYADDLSSAHGTAAFEDAVRQFVAEWLPPPDF